MKSKYLSQSDRHLSIRTPAYDEALGYVNICYVKVAATRQETMDLIEAAVCQHFGFKDVMLTEKHGGDSEGYQGFLCERMGFLSFDNVETFESVHLSLEAGTVYTMDEEKKGDSISIVWGVDDVMSCGIQRGIDIPYKVAKRVLALMEKRHDCNHGITWETVDCTIDAIMREEKEKGYV